MLRVDKSHIQSIRSCAMLSWHRCNADNMYELWRMSRKAYLLNVSQSCNSVVVLDNDLNVISLNKPPYYYVQWSIPLNISDISKAIFNRYRKVKYHFTYIQTFKLCFKLRMLLFDFYIIILNKFPKSVI